MRRSKLEMYTDILAVLSNRGQLKLTHLMRKTNVNCSLLKDMLDFLIEKDLVREATLRKEKTVFVITKRGLSVLKAFKQVKQVFPEVQERVHTTLLY
jgi:predicted transcriptional regulator